MPGVIRNNGNGAVQLSKNFSLSELLDSDIATRDGIENNPDPLAIANLFKVAALLEQVRKAIGDKTILVSSGFRCVHLNQVVGGSPTSDHVRGSAADFRAPSFGNPLQIAQAIVNAGIKFGQLIYEGTWVHISLPDGNNDGEVLTAKFIGGKARYMKGLVA